MGAEPNSKTGPSDAVAAVRLLIGSLAGLAALVYLSGGVVLSLRLALSGLPSIGVVGQVPREFLFSLAATSVIAPAVLIGVVVGAVELGQNGPNRLRKGHLPWAEAKQRPELRRSYVRFYAAAPLVLLAPAFVVAVERDHQVEHKLVLYPIMGVLLVIALKRLVTAAWDSRYSSRGVGFANPPKDDRSLRAGEWANIGFAGVFTLIPTAWVLLFEPHQRSPARYLGLTGAWLVTVLVVLGAVWLRGQIGGRYRKEIDRDEDKDIDERKLTVVIVCSWVVTALLCVPGLMAFAAALPLQDATACTKAGATKPAAGVLVGETGSRVYIGDDAHGRIISVPSANVDRLLFGKGASDAALCR